LDRADRPAAKLQIVAMTDAHAAPVAEFIRQVWDPDATADSVIAARQRLAAENVAEPGRPLPTFLAIQGNRVLGYVTTIAVQLQDRSGTAHPGYLLKGLMVLPEFRGGPIGYHVLKAAAQALPRSAGLAVAAPALRLFTGLGYRDVGAIPNLVQPLAPGRMLQRIDLTALNLSLPSWMTRTIELAQRTGLARPAGGLAGLVVRGILGLGRLPALGIRVRQLDPLAQRPGIDGLWQAARARFAAGVVRDSAYLLPRYPVGPGAPYTWVGAWRGTQLVGVAIVRQPRDQGDERLKGLRLATLSDIVYAADQSAVALALLGAVARLARRMKADALITSASSPILRQTLRRQLYVPLGGNVHLLYRDTEHADAFGTTLDDWFLTRGDGLADEIF
jgi:predicted N-acetyltransferase YhbS